MTRVLSSAAATWQAEARTHPVLEALDQRQWAEMVASARSQQRKAREPIFHQGDPVRRFFWVESGLVQLSRTRPGGQEQVVEVIRPHQLFAEALMFMEDEVAYPVDAICIRPARIVSFDNASMKRLIRASPELALRMLSLMAKRMHRLVTTIDELTLHTAVERIAQHLLDASKEREAFTLDIPKRVLASRLALTPESLSRVLADLRRRRLVDVQRTSVRIVDRKGLEELASG